MQRDSSWEKYYQQTPLKKIPWQITQASYFTKIIDSSKVKPGKALDLGCGTGTKSIYLAKRGFKVTGIDLSKTAIKYAKKNAQKARVKANFIVGDVIDLSFLGNQKFSFVLDWATLHGIPNNKRKKYVSEIINHSKKGGKLLLRCFSKRGVKRKSALRGMGKLFLFSRQDIEKLFGNYFKILGTNKSRPIVRKQKEPPTKWLDEYLMERV
jgi:2-polyprenyl-3-methyl-5-hydroxy-6-metoxy-1,4-benzoquinol methylase